MINSTDLLERLVNITRADLKTWLRFLTFRLSIPVEHPPQYFLIAVIVSVVIHSCLAYLLWIAVSGRTAVEPVPPIIIDTPLILSLSTFTTDSHDGEDLEVVSEVPHTDSPVQSSPESSSSAGRKSEAETVVTSKDQGVPDSEVPGDKPSATEETPSFDLEAAYNMKWDFGVKPVFEAETAVTSKGQGIPGSETPESKSLTSCFTPSFGLENFYCIEREFGRMSESEIMDMKIKQRMIYIENYIAETRAPHLDCRTAFMSNGLLAIPLLIKSAITGNDCKWYPKIKEIK